MGLFSSSRTVKEAGKNSAQARRGSTHGSKYAKRWEELQGRSDGRDRKPKGFLSRHDKPASGRSRGGPWG